MSAGTYNITAEQGATFAKVFTLRDSGGALIDLSGYTARMQVRESYASEAKLIELTTENGGITLGGALGTLALLISATDLAAIVVPNAPGAPPAKACVYDLEMISGAVVTRLLQGKFMVVREVTR